MRVCTWDFVRGWAPELRGQLLPLTPPLLEGLLYFCHSITSFTLVNSFTLFLKLLQYERRLLDTCLVHLIPRRKNSRSRRTRVQKSTDDQRHGQGLINVELTNTKYPSLSRQRYTNFTGVPCVHNSRRPSPIEARKRVAIYRHLRVTLF